MSKANNSNSAFRSETKYFVIGAVDFLVLFLILKTEPVTAWAWVAAPLVGGGAGLTGRWVGNACIRSVASVRRYFARRNRPKQP